MAPKLPNSGLLSRWLNSVNKFFEVWKTVRICPDKITAPQGIHSFNVLTLLVSIAIFLAARVSIAGSSKDIDAIVIATVISVLVIFLTGYVNLIVRPGPKSVDEARKWGTFFIMTWITSLLLLIVIDAIPFWMGSERLTTTAFNIVVGPDSLSPFARDFVRAFLFGIGALVIIIIKTKRMDRKFRVVERCTVGTIVLGLAVNTALLGGFIYGRVI